MQGFLFPVPTPVNIVAEVDRLESTTGYDSEAIRAEFPTPYRFLPVEQIPAVYQRRLYDALISQRKP